MNFYNYQLSILVARYLNHLTTLISQFLRIFWPLYHCKTISEVENYYDLNCTTASLNDDETSKKATWGYYINYI